MYVLLLLLLNLVLSSFLTGLIWFVQVVHYPIFIKVPTSHFVNYQTTHMHTTGQVVALPMLAELLVSILLAFVKLPGNWQWVNYGCLACVVLIWIVTFFVSVPIHNHLVSGGFNHLFIQKLVATNWLRTITWTLRTGLLGYILFHLVQK